MYTLKIEELKKLSAVEMREQIDRALSSMLYPHDDPDFVWPDNNQPDRLQILSKEGAMIAGELVAIRYLWFLYKKATVKNYKGTESPAWFGL